MSRVCIALFALMIVPAASAQNFGGEPGRGQWFDWMFDALAFDLQLDPAQRAEYDQLAAAARERANGRMRAWQEMQRAMQAGDEQRVAELRAQVQSGRGPGGAIEEVVEAIEPMLREDQLDRLDIFRERMEDRRREGELAARVRGLPDALGLDETQRQEYYRLTQEMGERMREEWGSMGPLFEQMRDAREAGDLETLRALQAQFEMTRPTGLVHQAAMLDQLAAHLRPDQLEALLELRGDIGQLIEPVAAATGGSGVNLRDLLRTARRVPNLNEEQREKLRLLEREALTTQREVAKQRDLHRDDAKDQEALAASVREKITQMLDTDQQQEFERLLKRAERRAAR